MAKDKNIPKSEVFQINKVYQSTVDFNKFLLENNILSNNKKTKVLDLGTGIGSNLKYFANQFKYSEFVGFDYSKKKIDYAKKLNKNKRISFHCADMLKKNGYKIKVIQPYFPKKPIKKLGKNRGSFTIQTEFSKNTVFAGPIFLPWHFVLAKRDN